MRSHRLSKLAAALGGFLILIGITMIGAFALVFSEVVEFALLKKGVSRVIPMGVISDWHTLCGVRGNT